MLRSGAGGDVPDVVAVRVDDVLVHQVARDRGFGGDVLGIRVVLAVLEDDGLDCDRQLAPLACTRPRTHSRRPCITPCRRLSAAAAAATKPRPLLCAANGRTVALMHEARLT